MELKCFRTLWGVTTPWSQALNELQCVGCCGIEACMPSAVAGRREFTDRLRASGLEYIAILSSDGGVFPVRHETPEQHLTHLQTRFAEASSLNLRFINLLAGNDCWSLAQRVDFFSKTHELAVGSGSTCSFKTHRTASPYSPWLMLETIQQLPRLRFTANVSHWVVVSKRLLDDPCDDLSAFIDRVQHVQTWAGHDQEPQVSHLVALEYRSALTFTKRFRQQIWYSQRQRSYPQTTLTPEFGADSHLHHPPFINVPVADLWSPNAWAATRQQAHSQQFLTPTEQEPQP